MSDGRNIVSTNSAPPAIGPYSQGITDSGRLVFISGQIPIDPVTGSVVADEIETQTRQSLSNLKTVLEAEPKKLPKLSVEGWQKLIDTEEYRLPEHLAIKSMKRVQGFSVR